MRLEAITPGLSLVGVEPDLVVAVVAAVPVGPDAITLVYRSPDGTIRERLVGRADEAGIAIATHERPWAFDGDAAAFQLTCEAKRMDMAFLFDPMMAVHSANVDPLPHQITAVYESLLPQQPLRFVLADDPGAGKTIMAGLYMRELIMRADAHRIVVVAPGSLVEQWKEELFQKFDLRFEIYGAHLDASSPSGNAFGEHTRLIVRLDQFSRNEELQERLCAAGWDLVVFDEAHKLAAHYYGTELKRTARYQFAEKLGAATRHLLLMTATPHNGKEEDFQAFMALLDSDRFYGRFRDGAHKVDTSDMMRRMVKEELVTFEGTPLFPERRAYTVNYQLSPLEAALYEAVTQYVRTEMGKADQLEGRQKGSVGFALTTLQRRLASSPEAIYQSLRRRRERLESRLREERLGARGRAILAETLREVDVPEDDDDLDAAEQEHLEEQLVDEATAARSAAELEAEIIVLQGLETNARDLVASDRDRKWEQLSSLLQHERAMFRDDGKRRKLIIFTEHRDTLNYLHTRISELLGNPDAVLTIHGGTHRDERLKVQALFRSDPDVSVLIGTDAAGEGVNLQVANLMVNYDLPWNPNRLEQRFGRIHRIGQREVCHLWNLVAKETREGDVYHRLLQKIEIESEALKGRVFDILGELFEEESLKELLIRAIRYGDQPDVRKRLSQRIDAALDRDRLQSLLDRNALAQETMSPERLFAVKEEMEKAEARRLQPYFVRKYCLDALNRLGGTAHPREAERYEVTHVPAAIRDRDRLISGRNHRESEPVLKRYDRICFSKEAVQPIDRPQALRAVLMHPGHPLMLAMTDVLLEQHANLLRQGAIFVHPSDEGDEPSLVFLLTHEIRGSDDLVISRRLQFVRVGPDGTASFAGWAPHLDLEPLAPADKPLVADILKAPWVHAEQEQRAIALAASTLVPEHFQEVATRRLAHVDKVQAAVHERLTKEINFWQDRWLKLRDDLAAGKDVQLNIDNARRTVTELQARLERRQTELRAMRHVVNGTPVLLGVALVISAGLLRRLRGEVTTAAFTADSEARSRVERIAMSAVRATEEARGHRVIDVSPLKCGWDLTSIAPETDGVLPEVLHIEVKGRAKGSTTVTVSRNEVLYALNQGEKFVLAIVLVGENDEIDGPHYIRRPFDREPSAAEASINFDLRRLLALASPSIA